MALSKISTNNKRKKLEPKKEPYYDQLQKSCFIGFRKSTNDKKGGSWIARYKTRSNVLGIETDYDYDQAKVEALKWIKSIGTIKNHQYNLTDAIADYEKKLPINSKHGITPEKARATARRLQNKLSDELLNQPLTKLTKKQVVDWRDGLVNDKDEETIRKSKDTSNRILTILKAALNTAYENNCVNSKNAWETIKRFSNVARSRELYLTDDEIKLLVNAVDGQFKDIVIGAILTGARYGELCDVLVEDYDKKNGLIKFTGKTGTRQTALSSTAINFFNKQCMEKLPKAFLFTKAHGYKWAKGDQKLPMKKAIIKASLPHDTVFYSLRHYYISKALVSGFNIHALAQNCGTSIRMIESNYGKFIANDVKIMLDNVIVAI